MINTIGYHVYCYSIIVLVIGICNYSADVMFVQPILIII